MGACQRFEILLSGYRDGELGSVSRWRVERHLASCSACARALKALEKVGACVKENEASQGHPDLWEKIRIALPAVDAEIEAQNATLWNRLRTMFEKNLLPNWDFSQALIGTASVFLIGLAIFRMQSQTTAEIRIVELPPSVTTPMPRVDLSTLREADLQRVQSSVSHRKIQSLNARGHSVMLLQDDPDTTIIWIMDREDETDSTPATHRSWGESQNGPGELL